MKKIGVAGVLFILSQILHAGTYDVFGDSLSDTGNLAKFTYNSGKLYNEHLASYLGEDFPQPNGGLRTLFESIGNSTPNSLVGPNWAQGGAVANTEWGLSNSGVAGYIKLQTAKQINKFLASGKTPEELKNHRVVFLVGGNDLRIAFENNTYSDKTIMDKSIDDVGKQVATLADAGVGFLIIPKVPDISYTPKFLKTFGKVEKIKGKTLYKEKSGFFFSSGISEDEYERILDLIEYKDEDNHEVIIKKAIKQLLEKQKEDSSDKNVDIWYSKYKEKKKELSDLASYFNDSVDKKLKELQEKNPNLAILRPDISNMFKEAVENPELYGFTNAVGTASKSFSSAITPSWYNPFGSGTGRDRIAAFDPEDNMEGKAGIDKKHLWKQNRHYLFADEFHPSPELHKISADYMLSILENDNEEIYDDSVNVREKFSKDQTYILNLKEPTERIVKEDRELKERGYVHFGAVRLRNAADLDWTGLNIKNVGTAISLEGKNTTATISDYSINNIGMITSTIEVNDGADLQLANGKINVERGSKITYPFGVRVNGENSKFSMIDSELKLKGKGSTGITVGNGAEIQLSSSKVIVEDGVALNLWKANADLKESFLKSDETGVHIFSNDNMKKPTNLTVEGGKIEAKGYAIKISPNITKFSVIGDVNINKAEVLGGILTGKNSMSNINFTDSRWENNRDSNITNLSIDGSTVIFSQGEGFNTITVEDEYASNNGKFLMKGNLNNANGDMFVVNGKASGTTIVEFENIDGNEKSYEGITTLSMDNSKKEEALKLIDLRGDNESSKFILSKPIYVGDAEYTLVGDNKIYLTSTLVELDGNYVVPYNEVLNNSIVTFGNGPININKNYGRKIKLERPKKVFFEQYQKINMVSNKYNIFHEKERNEILLSSNKEKNRLKGSNKEVEIEFSSLRFSYPLNEKTGVFFSTGEHKSKFSDLNRVYFGKDKNIGSLKRKDYVLGMYYQNDIYKYLKLDNILEYQYIKNKYNVEDKDYKNNGHAISYSTLAWVNIPITPSLSIEPQYQLDITGQKLNGYSKKYDIGNSIGGSIKWKKSRISLEIGAEKEWKIKNNINYSYDSKGIEKYVRGEYKPIDEFKVYAEVKRKNTSKDNSYELGMSYKF